jgi:lipoyl(octanoyl) transferase
MFESRMVNFEDLGRMPYQEAWAYQEELLQQNIRIKAEHHPTDREEAGHSATSSNGIPTQTRNHLLFVEHPPVFTLGKSGHLENLLIQKEGMDEKGIQFFHTNRGGDITFHGPGQVVAYPIFDLEVFGTDIGKYLRNLEEVIIRTLKEYGIDAGRSAGETGVWLDPSISGRERKIAALGVRCSRWITMHGFAFNVNTDLSYFDHIIPCGIQHKKVTSLQREKGREIDLGKVKERLKHHFEEVFRMELREPIQPRIPSE